MRLTVGPRSWSLRARRRSCFDTCPRRQPPFSMSGARPVLRALAGRKGLSSASHRPRASARGRGSASERFITEWICTCQIGDARELTFDDGFADGVLLLGPLYHLTETAERLRALREVYRVLRPGGVMFAAAISRYASALDGIARDLFADPAFAAIVQQDLEQGQHRNETNNWDYFTTAYFHRPDELQVEVVSAGFSCPRCSGSKVPDGSYQTSTSVGPIPESGKTCSESRARWRGRSPLWGSVRICWQWAARRESHRREAIVLDDNCRRFWMYRPSQAFPRILLEEFTHPCLTLESVSRQIALRRNLS